MQYTAATCVAAARPVTLSIGRVSSRRGLVWLSRWWFRRFRTWQAKPLSVPQMLTLQAANGDPIAYVVALAVILRAVLPWRWWYRVTGDPVALILWIGSPRGGNDPTLQGKVLASLLTVPGSARDESRISEIEQIRAQQRAYVYGTAKTVPSLAHAALRVRATYGDAWYYAPHRWPTSDGYAPFAVTWVEFAGLAAIDAADTLRIAQGTALPHAKHASRELQKLATLAYPTEAVH